MAAIQLHNPSLAGGPFIWVAVTGAGTSGDPYQFTVNADTGGGGPYPATPLGYQQLTSLGSAAGLTVPNGATFCYIIVETNSIRWRDDGTNPTTSVGMLVQAGGFINYSGSLSAIKFIAVSGSPVVDVSYYQ